MFVLPLTPWEKIYASIKRIFSQVSQIEPLQQQSSENPQLKEEKDLAEDKPTVNRDA